MRNAVIGVVLATALGMVSISLGQDAPPAPQAEPPPQPSPGAGRTATDDEEFIPTEELSADEAVTFPVDI